jgi:predicted nucleotidyltransferase component of viral defense system
MIEKILKKRLGEYPLSSALDQENALAEILQLYVLTALARAGFFGVAEFHGGTFLRLVHGMDRFSEDLDFVLKKEDRSFAWTQYLDPVAGDLAGEGLNVEIVDRTQAENPVKKAFLKTDAIGKQFIVDLPFERHPRRKVRIKLEIDTAPPEGSTFETAYLSFPVTSAITVQTLGSAFAGKSHALLCRNYTKGRDWFDFLWYADRGVEPNFRLLQSAIEQVGPWAGQGIRVTPDWYFENMAHAIGQVDWSVARQDVERFLPSKSRESIALWTTDLFVFQLNRLKRRIQNNS